MQSFRDPAGISCCGISGTCGRLAIRDVCWSPNDRVSIVRFRTFGETGGYVEVVILAAQLTIRMTDKKE